MYRLIAFSMVLFSLLIGTACSNTSNNDDTDTGGTDSETQDTDGMMSDNEMNDGDDGVTDDTVDDALDDTDNEMPDNGGAGTWCEDLSLGGNIGPEIEGAERVFHLEMPTGETPEDGWPVIFSWHGVGDSMANFKSLLDPYVDNEIMSFIAVTPENDPAYAMSGGMPKGIDWDILNLNDGSVDVELFDEILSCLRETYPIDDDHIHSTGFSAGAINTDALATLRSEELASIFTYSGGYLGNNSDQLGQGASLVSWPPLNTENKFVEMRVHGGENDQFDLSVTQIHFNEMAEQDIIMLNDKGHDAVVCAHDSGHAVDGVSIHGMLTFFKDHPRGTANSPYAEGFPESFFDNCEFSDKL